MPAGSSITHPVDRSAISYWGSRAVRAAERRADSRSSFHGAAQPGSRGGESSAGRGRTDFYPGSAARAPGSRSLAKPRELAAETAPPRFTRNGAWPRERMVAEMRCDSARTQADVRDQNDSRLPDDIQPPAPGIRSSLTIPNKQKLRSSGSDQETIERWKFSLLRRPCSRMLPRNVDSPSPSNFSELQKPLEHFRAKTKRLKIHPAEMLLLVVITAHVVFLPWAIGGMRPWGQFISLALAIISLALALAPRNYTPEHTSSNSFRLVTWPRLFRFPIFWIGLLLLAYVTVQGLNPAWTYVTNGKSWWMQKIDHIAWLPAGVRVPYERWGPWRMLVIYASAWMTVCAIWTGFTRRRTVQTFFIAISVNGVALAGFGLTQKVLTNGKMFWIWDSLFPAFFSSFVYKNHAGSYLDLTLFVTCGLAAWYYLRGLRRLEKSNPAGLFAFLATCIAVTVLVSYARGATIVMLIFLCVMIGAFLINQLFLPNATRKPIVAVMLLIIFGYFLKTGLATVSSHEAWTRLSSGITNEDNSIGIRQIATRASLDMLKDYWGTGAGAGSFQFLFPLYQQHYPEIYSANGNQMFWEHAHNDLVELSIELGLPGILLILAATGYWVILLCKNYFWGNPLSVCVVIGAVLLTAYAWWDFPFQNPAILVLWCSLGVTTAMWTMFEELNIKG